MIRYAVCVLAALPVLALADMRSDLQAKYTQLDNALARLDVKTAEKWLRDNATADFSYTSHDKNKYDLAGFAKGLRDQIAVTKKVTDSGVQVIQVKQIGNMATVTAKSHTNAKMTFDGQPMTLVDKSQTTDTWVKVGSAWKIKRSVQTAADTQMFQK
jgi:ketosteroid isomerase-like protein